MLRVYRTVKDECGYPANRFHQATKKHGGLAYAKRLLAQSGTSEGFKVLQKQGRLDLAMESLVLQPLFRELFTEREIEIARSRLNEARAARRKEGAT